MGCLYNELKEGGANVRFQYALSHRLLQFVKSPLIKNKKEEPDAELVKPVEAEEGVLLPASGLTALYKKRNEFGTFQ